MGESSIVGLISLRFGDISGAAKVQRRINQKGAELFIPLRRHSPAFILNRKP